MKDKISVILPVYNVEKYIDKCLDSIVNQTYKNLEIILVDDGSPDNSGKKCAEWAKKDKRIKVFHKENGGVSSARNLGLDNATGDYIGFVDPDDIIDSHMYEEMINKINQEKSDMCLCGFKYINETDNKTTILNEINLEKINKSNICNYFLSFGSKKYNNEVRTNNIMGSVCRTLINREKIGRIRFEKLLTGEDVLFLIDITNQDINISAINKPFYGYLQRNNSAMRSFDNKRIDRRIETYKLVTNRIINRVDSNIKQANDFHFYASCLDKLIKYKELIKAQQILEDDFFIKLNSKDNYKCAMKNVKGLKFKVAYFLLHRKMLKLYSFVLRFV